MNMKKLLTIIAALFVFFASGAQNINLHRQDASVRELMQEIQQKYGYHFLCLPMLSILTEKCHL